jgi:hypothetical protein
MLSLTRSLRGGSGFIVFQCSQRLRSLTAFGVLTLSACLQRSAHNVPHLQPSHQPFSHT